MSASTLFDKLREEMGVASDAALARELKVSQCVISQARREQAISDRMILRIHESTIWTAKEIRAELAKPAPHQYHDNPPQVSATEASQ
jgi:predicted transcriptional regulator